MGEQPTGTCIVIPLPLVNPTTKEKEKDKKAFKVFPLRLRIFRFADGFVKFDIYRNH